MELTLAGVLGMGSGKQCAVRVRVRVQLEVQGSPHDAAIVDHFAGAKSEQECVLGELGR